jgi:hypothetical protein
MSTSIESILIYHENGIVIVWDKEVYSIKYSSSTYSLLSSFFVVNLKLSSVPLALKNIPGKYIKEDPW